MTFPTRAERDQIESIAADLTTRGGFSRLNSKELGDVAGICFKLGCTTDNFVVMVMQMGLDSLARMDVRTMVYLSAACGGRPELDLCGDDLPF